MTQSLHRILSFPALLLALFLLFRLPLPLTAQPLMRTVPGSWTRTNPGGGGAFTAVGAGPTGLIVVGSDLSGAYLSHDQGQQREPIGAAQGLRGKFTDNVSAIGFDPQDGNIFYLGTLDGIYRTGDGGRQFQRLNTERTVVDDVTGELYTVNGVILAITIAPGNPNIGYAAWHPYDMAWQEGINARQGQVFRTSDRGLTWAKVSNASLPNTLRLIDLVVHPTNPELVYALSGESRAVTGDFALYRSRDGGRTWTRLDANLDRVHDIALDKRNPNILYLTTADLLDADHAPWDCPSSATTGKFYRSENGGDTWTKVADRSGRIWVDGDDQFAVRLLQPDHQNNWADACSGLWESTDRGVTWQRVAEQRNWGRGWYGFDTGYRWSFEPARTLGEDLYNPDRLLWIDDGFVYGTSDDGRTFQNLHSDLVAPGRWRSRGIDNVVMLDMALGASANAVQSDVYLAYYDIGCWHSGDGGASWSHCSLPDPNFTDGRKGWDNFTTLVADPTRVGVVWAAHAWDRDDPQSHELLRSEDAGKNWQIIGSDKGVMSGLTLDPNSPVNNRTLFVTIGEDLYRSQDDGRSWQKVYDCNGCWFTAVDGFNRNLIYAGGDAGFFRSTQGGAAGSWRKVNFADFVGRDGNPWWWGDVQDGWQGIHDIVTNPVRTGWLYATVFRYFDPDQPTQPQGGLYRSQDGGVTWQQLLPNNYRHYLRDLAIFPLDNRGLFVTSCSSNCCGGDPTHSHGVLRSVDGGATWTQVNLCRIGIAQRGNR
jgi:photosystem II stability/assembly factor-like uncharacterized protein